MMSISVVCLAWSLCAFSETEVSVQEELWTAAKRGDVEQIQTLLESGANINAATEFNATALYFAASNDRPEACEALLKAGASPEIADNFYQNTPLGMAGWLGHERVVEVLVAGGASGARGTMFAAAGNGHVSVLQVLFDLEEPDPALLNQLWATANGAGRPQVAAFLVERGATPSPVEDTAPAEAQTRRMRPAQDPFVPVVEPRDWPGFRGEQCSGVADGQHPPLSWSVEEGDKIRWQTAIPGLGHSSPVIRGNRVFVTTAVGEQTHTGTFQGDRGWIGTASEKYVHRYEVLCFELSSGKLMWRTLCHEGVPKTERHWKASHASSTCAVDDDFVVAHFGSEGMYCLNLSGEVQWSKDLGILNAAWFVDDSFPWGYASSPTIFEGLVFVQCDVAGQSFVAAFDLESGEQIWRTERDEISSWGTPTVGEGPDGPELILNGTNAICSYDLESGDELWRIRDNSKITVASPVASGGIAFVTGGYQNPSPIYAVRLGALGDLTLPRNQTQSDAILWSNQRDGVYQPTPLVYDGHLYLLKSNGVLSCYDPETGQRHYRVRVDTAASEITASLVAADGFLYVTTEAGEVLVVRAGPAYELVAINDLGERTLATPAISNGMAVFRTESSLIGVGFGSSSEESE